MRKFSITIGRRDAPRLAFEAMTESWSDAWDRHIDLAHEDERLEVSPVPSDTEKLAADAASATDEAIRRARGSDHDSLQLQVRDMRCAGAL